MPLPKDMDKCMSKVKKEYPSGRKKKGTKMSKKNVHKQHVAMCMNEAAGSANVVVVYGGRFQPFHKGHYGSYEHLVNKYGADKVYVASAEKPPGPKDPFTFDEKKKMAVSMGVPADHFVKVKNVYNKDLIKQGIPFDENNTILIVALSQKDGDRLIQNVGADGLAYKKNGDVAVMQWLNDSPKSAAEHIYVDPTPTVTFPVAGENVTGATEIRNLYKNGDESTRMQILKDLYPKPTKALKNLFDKRIGEATMESILEGFKSWVRRI
jgi:hypothetical protein